MPFLDFILCILLLQGSHVNTSAQVLGLGSRDIFDSSLDFTDAEMDSISFLDDSTEHDLDLASPFLGATGADPMEFSLDAEPVAGLDLVGFPLDAESVTGADPMEFALDAEPVTELDLTSLDSDGFLTAVDSDALANEKFCSNESRKRMRKRNDAICPAPEMPPNLGIFVDEDTDADTYNAEDSLTTGGGQKPECEEKVPALGRIFDVCCNGPLGPFAIDHRVRLVYNYIGGCRLGMPNPGPIRVL